MSAEFERPDEATLAEMRSLYTETVVDHAVNPRNAGSIQNPDGFASITGSCGDTMEMGLRVKDDRILIATFWTDGCAATIAAGSMTAELAKGKALTEALGIAQQDVLDALRGLPEGNRHCALLAADTLKAAIGDYLVYKSESWKRAYRRH